MKTSELTERTLDYAVAKAQGVKLSTKFLKNGSVMETRGRSWMPFAPSSSWLQGGPIIEREKIKLEYNDCAWDASMVYENDDDDVVREAEGCGATPLIAAMRCYVASKLGDEVEIPKELM